VDKLFAGSILDFIHTSRTHIVVCASSAVSMETVYFDRHLGEWTTFLGHCPTWQQGVRDWNDVWVTNFVIAELH
jgi:hypothetical protein